MARITEHDIEQAASTVAEARAVVERPRYAPWQVSERHRIRNQQEAIKAEQLAYHEHMIEAHRANAQVLIARHERECEKLRSSSASSGNARG